MQIHLQTQGFSLTEAIDNYVRQRLGNALGDRFDQVRRVNVWLSDINGPRGGKDKRCRIQISLAGTRDVVIGDTRHDLYHAITRAAGRIRQTLDRRLSKQAVRPRRLLRQQARVDAEPDDNTNEHITAKSIS